MMQKVLWGNVTVGRFIQHGLFWGIVFAIFTAVYAIKSTYLIAAHNNLFYLPVHMAYFYAIAYWLIPGYLFKGRYVQFVIYTLLLVFLSAFICRLIDMLITTPYMMKRLPNIDWSYIEDSKHTFWQQLTNPLNFSNSMKMTNQVIWFAVGVKLFKHWYERKQAALQAELSALKGQVHPHFLFNTLNNLYALTLNNSPKSPQVVLGLSELLRYMLYECNADKVSLQQELLMMQQYVALEKLRYEDRLDLAFNMEGEAGNKLIAPLMLLPLVENAFKHGTSEVVGQAWININVQVAGNELKFKIANSKAATEENSSRHFGHIGLTNLRKRLDLLYPSVHKLKVLNDEDTFLAILELELTIVAQPETITVLA